MLDNVASYSRSRVQAPKESLKQTQNMSEHDLGSAGRCLTGDLYLQSDKPVLARLLKLGVEDALAQGNTFDPTANEPLTRLIPILFSYFSLEELAQLIDESIIKGMLEVYRIEVLQNLFLESKLHQLLHAFNEAQIPLIVFKGSALAYTVYPNPSHRTYQDIDTLIHPHDLPRTHTLLTSMGYKFYEEFRSNTRNNKRTGYNYVTEHPDSWLAVQVELHTAPHSSEMGTTFDTSTFWTRAKPLTMLDEPTLTLHPVDHLLFLSWHYRFHGFSRLVWLYDLVVLLRTIDQKLDWNDLVETARRQRMATTLYYCLSWCRDLFGVTIPDEVFSRLRPPLLCQHIIKRAILDPVRTLSADSLKAQRIVVYRAMVDSHRELFKTGLRMLFPSRIAMGQRYMNHSKLPLQFFFLFYLIHPWITLSKGCSFLIHRYAEKKES